MMKLRDWALKSVCVYALCGGAWAEIGELTEHSQEVQAAKDQRLADFARSKGLAAEQVAWANGLRPTSQVRQGQELTVPARILPAKPPADGAVVNLAERGVYLFKGGEYQGFFPISIGRQAKSSYHTPTGSYEVISRVEDPTWTAPDSDWAKAMKKDRIAPDDPNNPLGEYWFGFSHPDGGYGFHENTNPDYTGDAVSHGCMRLNPEHAKKIYEEKLLEPGMTVRIENRPIVLGRSADGELMVSVFPPTYGRASGVQELAKALEDEHLDGMVSPQRLRALTESPTGTPTRLLGPSVDVNVGDQPWKGKTGILRGANAIVPVALARELGCQVQYKAETGEIVIARGERSQAFQLTGEGRTAYRWGDDTMVSARSLFGALDIPFRWNSDSKRLEVEM